MAEIPLMQTPASEIMSKDPTCVELWADVTRLARLLDADGISGAPVVDRQGRLVGVVSKTDLLHRWLERSDDYDPRFIFELMHADEDEDADEPVDAETETPRVEDFMTEDPITVAPDDTLATIAARMADAAVHRVIVVDDDVPVGVITSMDIVRLLAESP
jgi:CBS domain-containing protein